MTTHNVHKNSHSHNAISDCPTCPTGVLAPLSPTIGKNYYSYYKIQGNLPVERAKDAVCFLQRCGVSLVSSYTVCFLQRGGLSLALSAIIYNSEPAGRSSIGYTRDFVLWSRYHSTHTHPKSMAASRKLPSIPP